MTIHSHRLTLSIAATALLAGIAMPVAAAAKPVVVTLPASVLANPDAKLCMPRTTSPLVAKDKTLPKTLCQTAEAWAAHGVTLKSK